MFVGECYISKDFRGTNTHGAYKMGTRIQKGRRVTVYWRKELNDAIRVIMEEDRAMGIEVGGKRIFGVYGKSGGRRLNYEGWLDRIGRKSIQRDTVLVRDWNAHHGDWEEGEREDGKGRALAEWTAESGYTLLHLPGLTWERTVGAVEQQSRIDLVFTRGDGMWDQPEKEKMGSDHWALFSTMETTIECGEQTRSVVDWEKVEHTLAEEGMSEEERGGWYKRLEGDTAYDKLINFRNNHLKGIRIGGRSKR